MYTVQCIGMTAVNVYKNGNLGKLGLKMYSAQQIHVGCFFIMIILI